MLFKVPESDIRSALNFMSTLQLLVKGTSVYFLDICLLTPMSPSLIKINVDAVKVINCLVHMYWQEP